MSLNRPFYEGRPIGSIGALARALGVDASRLRRTAARSDRLYDGPIVITRPGRNPRTVFSASPKLRDIQQRILDRVLRRVHFPGYLMGGLEGRSYIDNARRHSGTRVLFGQDVDAFYPSIPRERIRRIFLDIFHFAPEVASLLARLTSRMGELVQGGVASTHLANLALYRTEPELERQLRDEGLTYSRFVDDVHVSSRTSFSIPARARVISSMRACLERHGYRPKRKKQFVVSAGAPMHVHRLNVNSSASVPSHRRQQLRNEVFLLERWTQMQLWDDSLERVFLRLSARVGQLQQTNAGEARRLKHRMNALLPARSARVTTIPLMPGEMSKVRAITSR
jgi:Reverse transcriptase (RNA-dependent DNA polymerase)